MNWEKLKQTLGVTPKIVEEPKKISPEEERKAVMAKEKEEATAKGEPWVGVLDTKVNPENIRNLKRITNLDGFLIGGASQNSKKFIDIVKKTYN